MNRDFKVAAALYQPPDRQEDVNVTVEAESTEQRWAFCRYKAFKHICRILAVLLSSFISFVVSLSVLDFRFDMGSIKIEPPSVTRLPWRRAQYINILCTGDAYYVFLYFLCNGGQHYVPY